MKTLSRRQRRLQSVMSRDARADDTFVYAVRTTGIYCRPSCPSRRPKPESIEFFATCAAAERAGYRSCKRCVPHQMHRQRAAVLAVCRHIDAHSSEVLPLQTLGRKAGLSPHHLQRLFKQTTGVSPREYQEMRRIAQFRNGVRKAGSVTPAMHDAGFGSSSRLYEKSSRWLGMTPAAYRKQGCRQNIAFTVFDSALGKVLLAATPRGVCKVSLGANVRALERELRTEFCSAVIIRDDPGLKSRANKINRFLQGGNVDLRLPLDVRATAFQRQVWEILKKIPRGATRSYSAIAQQAGMPDAVRAVASAIASNPVALLIPCHRAIRKSGALAGYRWGMARKAALLAMEIPRRKSRQRQPAPRQT